MKKVLWVKIGWAERYQGDVVLGKFKHPAERRAEMFNFLPTEKGLYCGYTGYMSGSSPWSIDPKGWTIIYLARDPFAGGMHIVGWYEDAEFIGSGQRTDVAFPPVSGEEEKPDYSVQAKRVFLVPPNARTKSYSHRSIGSAKFSYLSGPDVDMSDSKSEVRTELFKRIRKLRSVAIENPQRGVAIEKVDPLFPLGSAEFRAKVEKAAINAVTKALKKQRYHVKSHESLNRGYDLKAKHRDDDHVIRIEVKGTSATGRRFFLSANEYRFRTDPEWRFALVTDALGNPKVEILTMAEFEEQFDLAPMVWIGTDISQENA